MFNPFKKDQPEGDAQNSGIDHDLANREDYPDGVLASRFFAAVDKAVKVQAPVVDKYVTNVEKKNPNSSKRELQAILDKQFKTIATASGVGNGGIAAIPGLGTMVSLATVTGEGFALLELAALYTLASARLRELDISTEEQRRAIVLLAVSGTAGQDVIKAFTQESSIKGVTGLRGLKSMPTGQILKVNSTLGRLAFSQIQKRFGKAMLGKLMPFGIGAYLGGKANGKIADMMIEHVHNTLGAPDNPVDKQESQAVSASQTVASTTDSVAGSEE